MRRTIARTIHIPETEKRVQDRCTGQRPRCSMNHYFTIPAISARGTWKVEELARFSPLTGKSAR